MPYMAVGGFSAPAIIHSFNPSNMKLIKSLTLDTDEDDIEWMAKRGNYLYAVSQVGRVIKINLRKLTRIDSLLFPVGGGEEFGAVIKEKYLYVCNSSEYVYKVDLNTFTYVSAIITTSEDPASLHIKDNYLYAVHYSNPGAVSKINLDTFTLESTLILTTENVTCGLIIGNYLYCGHVQNPGVITKVNLNTFTEESKLSLTIGENRAECLARYNDKLLIGLHTEAVENIAMPYLAKVDLTTFTEDSDSPLSDSTLHRAVWAAEVFGNYAILGNYYTPPLITKINLTTFVYDSDLSLVTGENMSRNIIRFNRYGGNIVTDQLQYQHLERMIRGY